MNMAIVGPVLALIGILAGAYFTRSREAAKFRKDRITEAYTAYIKIAADSSGPRSLAISHKQLTGQPLTAEEIAWPEEQQQRFANAHANLLLYGSKRVVTALSDFYDASAAGGPGGIAGFVELITAMRADSDAASYGDFARHVDNVLGTGPDRRRLAMQQAFAAQQAGQQQGGRTS